MKDLNQLADEVHQNAINHGWAADRNPYEILALIHSEVSEALEELRKGFAPDDLFFEVPGDLGLTKRYAPGLKPAGVPSELADVIIRVLDACGAWGVDIQQAVDLKMEYNRSRPYRHGGKKA